MTGVQTCALDLTDLFKNPGVREYQYYVCGLKIGSEDYTVKTTIAVDNKGDQYYDVGHVHATRARADGDNDIALVVRHQTKDARRQAHHLRGQRRAPHYR